MRSGNQLNRAVGCALQVSYGPIVTCYHCQSHTHGWHMTGEYQLKSKFWGPMIEARPAGTTRLTLPPPLGHQFVWNKARMTIHNIVLGKLWVEWTGDVVVCNQATGETARVTLEACGGKRERIGNINGVVKDGKGTEVYRLGGNYLKEITCEKVGHPQGKRVVYRCNPTPEDWEEQYFFTKFAITLNELTEQQAQELPPTGRTGAVRGGFAS